MAFRSIDQIPVYFYRYFQVFQTRDKGGDLTPTVYCRHISEDQGFTLDVDPANAISQTIRAVEQAVDAFIDEQKERKEREE